MQKGSMNELKHNAFYESVNSAKRFLRKRFRSFGVTKAVSLPEFSKTLFTKAF